MDAGKRMGGRLLVVQDQRHKLVLDFDRKQEELFDLENDPRELRALPPEGEKSARARQLRRALQHLDRPARGLNRELTIRSRLREVGLEWKNSEMHSKTLAS
jgi:hypothetical protein